MTAHINAQVQGNGEQDYSAWRNFAAMISLPDDRTATSAVSWYLILTPLLWSLGLLVPTGCLIVMWLLIWRWPEDPGINLVVAAWLLTAAAQAAAVIWNWSVAGEPFSALPRRLMAFSIIGWLFLGIMLAVGYSYRLANARLVRGIMLIGLYIGLFTVLGFLLAFVLGIKELRIPTPLAFVLGRSPATDYYATMRIYLLEESFGLEMPRMILFYPWPTALGLAGIGIVMAAFCESSRHWRAIGMLGGICAIVFSFSRAAMVALVVSLLVYGWLRAALVWKFLFLVVVSLAALGLVVLDVNPVVWLKEFFTSFSEARAGSSLARDLIYVYSWEGFLASPVFGQGWIGESVHPIEDLPIGSHSSLYGTLYTGGATTLTCLAAAGAVTMALLMTRAWRGTPFAAAGLSMAAALLMFAYGESLFSLVLPCTFMFLFMGGAMRPQPLQGKIRLSAIGSGAPSWKGAWKGRPSSQDEKNGPGEGRGCQESTRSTAKPDTMPHPNRRSAGRRPFYHPGHRSAGSGFEGDRKP